MNKQNKLVVAVAAMVVLIYCSLYYTGNFDFNLFLQGFGENLAAFIIVAVGTYLIVDKNRRGRRVAFG